MATLLLSAVGTAIGGTFGSTFLGLSGAVLGKAVGATVGSIIDQTLLGSEPVEVGRVSSFRVQGSQEGAPLPRVAGRMRVAGQLIWSTRFNEHVHESGGSGKGLSGGQSVEEYSYSVSVAIGLCQGPILRIGRVWADGAPFALEDVTYRLHRGEEADLPDSVIEAVEGAGEAPAYRGAAYIVFEDLNVTPFGNRIPQFNIEIFRQPDVPASIVPEVALRPGTNLRGVALTPGTGEYSLSAEPVSYYIRKGETRAANSNNSSGQTDLVQALNQLDAELPACDAVSLVVSWFGDDLRCNLCRIEPAVEQKSLEGIESVWSVSGVGRGAAKLVSYTQGRPTFGGTPSDASVISAISALRADGKRIMFYPFILMDIPAGNGLIDPWTGAADQPVFPWRGRITLSTAPGQGGSPDKTTSAASEVAAFFGSAQAGDFSPSGSTVGYSGPPDWGLRRFVLHYAHLCALAGGVDAFCIGSELRSLTQIRDGSTNYPAVQAFKALAADVRSILGPATKISYAADWSEYFGHQPVDGSGDVLFHLDPLWTDANIDFIGIDNYMPLSDWRDEAGHLDAGAKAIYDMDYLSANVAGGEGYDWFYSTDTDRDNQSRTPIQDGAHGEDWVFRYKDILNWWSQPHHDRPGGIRLPNPTSWVPQSKPVWFTEFGCPAVDKGTNRPNVFVDPKSSESILPYFSSGARDDFIQLRYLEAHFKHWKLASNNPVSPIYSGPMVDLANVYAWAWDARPWPDFPAREDVWSDGPNYRLGHWLQGRIGSASLPELVAELCLDAGLSEIDVSEIYGVVTGFAQNEPQTARQAIQPLMLGYRFDSTGRAGKIHFRMRDAVPVADMTATSFALGPRETEGSGIELMRGSERQIADAVRIAYLAAENDYQSAAAEAVHPQASLLRAESGELPVVLGSAQAQDVAERWLAEMRVARDSAKFNLPLSMLAIEPGDVVRLSTGRADALFRVGTIEEQGPRLIDAKRVEAGVYRAGSAQPRAYTAPGLPVLTGIFAQFLDLPLLRGDEVAHAPWLAVSATPWPGRMACFDSATDNGYTLNSTVRSAAVVGDTLDPLPPSRPWSWYRGPGIQVTVSGGTLQSQSELSVLNGGNAAAIRPQGTTDWEIIQFRDAVLVGQQTYLLSHILRGQAGTEFLADLTVPAGSDFVLLDRGPVQINLAASDRGLQRHYRIGPASRPFTDPAYKHLVESFAGIGLRPYAPVHLFAERQSGGDIDISWIRRSRVNGDNWAGPDIPLGEDFEAYELRIVRNGSVIRTIAAVSQTAGYSVALQAADQITTPFDIEVAQISASFGAGPGARITFNG